jgi:ubiquinone/menaquinone biosynthesis C-methylase UbiE
MRKLAAILLLCFSLQAQVATQANSRYRTEEGRKQVAASLGRHDRDQTQRPRELLAAIGIRKGMTVADIGTGIGYMLPFLAEAVGPDGKVLAEDIFDDFLAQARERAKSSNLTNVTFVKGTEADPSLPESAVDLVFVLDAYHHFDYPEKMLAGIQKALRPGGRLVVVEFYQSAMGSNHVRFDEPGLIKELEANRFRLVSKHVHVQDRQYVLILERS